jgi:hypothetical protein
VVAVTSLSNVPPRAWAPATPVTQPKSSRRWDRCTPENRRVRSRRVIRAGEPYPAGMLERFRVAAP